MSSQTILKDNPPNSPRLFNDPMPVGVYSPQIRAEKENLLLLPRREFVEVERTPHWYQSEAIEELNERFGRGSEAELLVLPTGCGKTFTASLFIQQCLARREPVLILCNRDRLITQMNDDLRNEGVFPLIEQAQSKALPHFHAHGICVLASVQTMRGERLKSWPKDAFKWVISDEAHNVPADSWRVLIEHFRSGGAKHLGLTATPYRSDNKSLRDDFNFPWVRKLTLREAIEGKFLARLQLKIAPIEPIDLRQVGIVGKDFDHQALDRVIWENTNLIASVFKQLAVREDGQRRALVGFTPHVVSADGIAAAMRDFGVPSSSISWRSADPDSLYERFNPQSNGGSHLGDLHSLLNVSILAEGFNAPWVEAIGMARPTLSIGVVTQQIGRGTRTSLATGKKDCLIIEIPCLSDPNGKNSLKSSLDAILDGAEDDEDKPSKEEQEFRSKVRERADKILRSETESDLLRAHDRAKEEITEESKAERERIRLARQEAARAKYQEQTITRQAFTYDPMDGVNPALLERQVDVAFVPASAEQIAHIKSLAKNVVPTQNLSSEAASAIIEKLEMRKRYRYASEPQLKMMVEWLGCDPRKAARMKKWDASTWIDGRITEIQRELVGAGWSWEAARALKPWELLPAMEQAQG